VLQTRTATILGLLEEGVRIELVRADVMRKLLFLERLLRQDQEFRLARTSGRVPRHVLLDLSEQRVENVALLDSLVVRTRSWSAQQEYRDQHGFDQLLRTLDAAERAHADELTRYNVLP